MKELSRVGLCFSLRNPRGRSTRCIAIMCRITNDGATSCGAIHDAALGPRSSFVMPARPAARLCFLHAGASVLCFRLTLTDGKRTPVAPELELQSTLMAQLLHSHMFDQERPACVHFLSYQHIAAPRPVQEHEIRLPREKIRPRITSVLDVLWCALFNVQKW